MKIGALEAGGTKMVCAVGDEGGNIVKRGSRTHPLPHRFQQLCKLQYHILLPHQKPLRQALHRLHPYQIPQGLKAPPLICL